MTCDQAREAVLDSPSGSRSSEALAEHLRECGACTALATDHARASALRIDSTQALRPLELAEIRSRVGTRRSLRMGFATAAALAAVAIAVRRPPPAQPIAPQVFSPLDMAELLDDVDEITHVDVAVADPAYAAFGPMARWFALPAHDDCTAAQPLSVDCFSDFSEDYPE